MSKGQPRNPRWSYEELVLAMDLYVRRGIVPKTDPELIELSRLLNDLRAGNQTNGDGSYRNPNGVHMKLANFRAHQRQGHGLQHGNRLERVLWERFKNRTDLLATEALGILSGRSLGIGS